MVVWVFADGGAGCWFHGCVMGTARVLARELATHSTKGGGVRLVSSVSVRGLDFRFVRYGRQPVEADLKNNVRSLVNTERG